MFKQKPTLNLTLDEIQAYYFIKHFKADQAWNDDKFFPNCYGNKENYEKLDDLGFIEIYDTKFNTCHARILKPLPKKYDFAITPRLVKVWKSFKPDKSYLFFKFGAKRKELKALVAMDLIFYSLGFYCRLDYQEIPKHIKFCPE